jgi:transposase-like protein
MPEVLTMSEQLMRNYLDSGKCACPACGSENIRIAGCDFTSSDCVEVLMECEEHQHRWVDEYEYTRTRTHVLNPVWRS